jgi:hypothetical protein
MGNDKPKLKVVQFPVWKERELKRIVGKLRKEIKSGNLHVNPRVAREGVSV